MPETVKSISSILSVIFRDMEEHDKTYLKEKQVPLEKGDGKKGI